jgi:hypothetical protein
MWYHRLWLSGTGPGAIADPSAGSQAQMLVALALMRSRRPKLWLSSTDAGSTDACARAQARALTLKHRRQHGL